MEGLPTWRPRSLCWPLRTSQPELDLMPPVTSFRVAGCDSGHTDVRTLDISRSSSFPLLCPWEKQLHSYSCTNKVQIPRCISKPISFANENLPVTTVIYPSCRKLPECSCSSLMFAYAAGAHLIIHTALFRRLLYQWEMLESCFAGPQGSRGCLYPTWFWCERYLPSQDIALHSFSVTVGTEQALPTYLH